MSQRDEIAQVIREARDRYAEGPGRIITESEDEAITNALAAAGLLVPPDITAEKLLRDVLAEMDATDGWFFRCLQPHSKSIVAAASFLDTQETPT